MKNSKNKIQLLIVCDFSPILLALPAFTSLAQRIGFELFFVFLPGADSFITPTSIKYLTCNSPIYISQSNHSNKIIKNSNISIVISYNFNQIYKILYDLNLYDIYSFGVTLSNDDFRFVFPYDLLLKNPEIIKNLIGIFELPTQPSLWDKYFEKIFSKIVKFLNNIHNSCNFYISKSIIQNSCSENIQQLIKIIKFQEYLISSLKLNNFKYFYYSDDNSKIYLDNKCIDDLNNLFLQFNLSKKVNKINLQDKYFLLQSRNLCKHSVFTFFSVNCSNIEEIKYFTDTFIYFETFLNKKADFDICIKEDTNSTIDDKNLVSYNSSNQKNFVFLVLITFLNSSNDYNISLIEDFFIKLRNSIRRKKQNIDKFEEKIYKTIIVYIDEHNNMLLLNAFENCDVRKFINFEEYSSYERFSDYLVAMK